MAKVPFPTFRCFLSQEYFAPTPEGGPAYSSFMFGSNLCQGDQFSQFFSVLTCSNSFSGGALMARVRSTCTLDGRKNEITSRTQINPIKKKIIRLRSFIAHQPSIGVGCLIPLS